MHGRIRVVTTKQQRHFFPRPPSAPKARPEEGSTRKRRGRRLSKGPTLFTSFAMLLTVKRLLPGSERMRAYNSFATICLNSLATLTDEAFVLYTLVVTG